MFKRLAFVKRLLKDPQLRTNVIESLHIVKRHATAVGRDPN